MLKLYNTLTHQKEKFKPMRSDQVGMYSCGPTVYDYDHLGHAWKYFNDDSLKRVLNYLGYKVKHVMNITDVGHLVSDGDEGEDKLEKGARREGKSPWEISEFYTDVFLANMEKMNWIKPDIICKATDHVQEMIEIDKKLVEKGFAYETEDALYFDISKFPKYGELSGNDLNNLRAGARVEVNKNKKDPFDFVLWVKAIGEHKNHIMVWDSPWGVGFPGWHIECSAMSMKYLGETLDIHTGGEDNIFPHHECEIAQSESATGKKFTNTWFHTRFMMVEGTKMSKSLGNFFRIQNIEEKGFDPLSLRYLFLTAHYRSQINFTWKSLEAAGNGMEKLRKEISKLTASTPTFAKALVNDGDIIAEYKDKFVEFINDDLNIPRAFALVWDILKSDWSNEDKLTTVLDFDRVFGLKLDGIKNEKVEIPEEVVGLAKERQKAREDKDWARADELRNKISEKGFVVEDTEGGFEIKKT